MLGVLGFGHRSIAIALAFGLLAIGRSAPSPPALAQDFDCASLKARIDSNADQRGSAEDGGGALQQRQFELDRLRNYSDSIGCGSGFFFGAPPQCDGIERRIARLQDTVEQLNQRMQDDGGESGESRRALIEQYNATCSRGSPGQPGDPATEGSLGPADPDAAPSDDNPAGASVHSKALCVRHCDGGFFPITEQATAGSLDRLGQICKALCPNAEASLYTMAPDAGLDTAVAPDGTSYTALPAAFRFQKSYDPTCSCKAANQSWAEALADAETLLEKNKSDVVVTKRMSDAMSRPAQPNAPDAAPPKPIKKAARSRKSAGSVSASRTPAAPQGAVDQPLPAPAVPDGEALTRQFRRAEPTL